MVDSRFRIIENGTDGRGGVAFCETRAVRDFANFGNRGRCAIPLGRKLGHWAGRFRLFGKRARCAISLIFGNHGRCGIPRGWQTETCDGGDFAYLEKRCRCAISLISEIVTGARDFAWPENGTICMGSNSLICETRHVRDFANFGNRGRVAISIGRKRSFGHDRFRLFGKRDRRAVWLNFGNRGRRAFRLAGKRDHWPEAMSLIWKTRPAHDVVNFGNSGRCAISLCQKTETLARKRVYLFGKRGLRAISLISEIATCARFHLAGKRNRRPENDSAYSENVADARFR